MDNILDDFENIDLTKGMEDKPKPLSSPDNLTLSGEKANDVILNMASLPTSEFMVKDIAEPEILNQTIDIGVRSHQPEPPTRPLKLLAIGDPHFKVSNVRETDEMVERICEAVVKHKPDVIVCLGDILDRHETIHVSPLMRATNFLKRLSVSAPLYAIIGNHDRPNNSNFLTEEHPFNAVKEWKNVVVVDKVVQAYHEGYRFVLVPYVPPGRLYDALATIDNPLENTTSILCHQEIYACSLGALKSEVGDKWPLEYPLMISGHIHDYQELQSNMIYTGTPIQHSFGDRDDKSISLFTFYPDKHFEHERIFLDVTKKKLVYLSCQEIITYEPPLNAMIKVVIRGTSSEIKAVMKLAKIKELQKKGVKISYKHLPEEFSDDNVEKEITPQMKYLDRLHLHIKDDPDVLKWYNKLFATAAVKG